MLYTDKYSLFNNEIAYNAMHGLPSITVSSTKNTISILQKARTLATKLSLSYTPLGETSCFDCVLLVSDDGLSLVSSPAKSGRMKTLLRPDYSSGKVGYRIARNLTIHQALAKAVGIKQGVRPTILDGTAGLGIDGFLLACLGSNVTLCERSPLLFVLLEDAVDRARENAYTADLIGSRIQLINCNTISFLDATTQKFDTIYLDPMYPHNNKNALNQQSMRTVRSLVGDDTDADKLFNCACENALNRVVVKRPKGAPLITDRSPSHVITMKNSRFDVYLRL